MQDRFGRLIDYLRISVTDRCNLRCVYCMPPGGIRLLPEEEILSFEEIAGVARTAVRLGARKIRLTGGEPLARLGIEELVRMLSGIAGVEDLAMTTNGTMLAEAAGRLAAAGLKRVNIGLNALDPERYRRLTRGGDVRSALSGIQAARRAGLEPIKINCVVEASSSEPDAGAVAAWAAAEGLEVRFIRRMNLATGEYWPVEGGTGGDCRLCNRLRLTSNGLIRPCLFSDLAFSVRELGPEEAILQAVSEKPQQGSRCTTNCMQAIGG